MTTDNTQMIDCYEVVPGLGIRKVCVTFRVYTFGRAYWSTLRSARNAVVQKPRVAPRTAVAVLVAEVGNPISFGEVRATPPDFKADFAKKREVYVKRRWLRDAIQKLRDRRLRILGLSSTSKKAGGAA